MSDRLDIDALLIGSLYGELSSADEARLQAHLESHPADRTALADLTRARTVVRESRIFELQAEPPQSISALLMQEAARRAPRKVEEKESWFQRFLASLRHPAMAAAAMLVVVVGVAGTIYLKKGDQFAEQTKSEAIAPASPVETTMTPPAGSAALAQDTATPPVATGDFDVRLEESAADGKADKQGTVGGLEVSTPRNRPMPKDLDSESKAEPKKEKRQFAEPPKPTTAAPSMVPEGKGRAPAADPAPSPAAPPPPPTSNYGAAGGAAGTSRGSTDKATTSRAPTNSVPAPAQEQQKPAEKETAEVAWAKAQHVKIVDRVRAGKCGDAANLAVQLSNRVPAYYQQHVENDRDLKQCFTVINRERELEAERVQRARAKQQRSDEAPRPAESTK